MTKILVIEDEEYIREILIEMLEGEDFDVVDASNGKQGLQLARETLPDLIICDIMMPEIDGYGVLTQLRQNPFTETTPFIFLTAKTAKPDQRQGMALGADDYVSKPFTREELLGTITAQLKKQAALNKQSQKKLDELRGNILHALPHELHTPLNGILGLSRILIDDYDLTERDEALEILEKIYTSGQRLYRLTQNFLLHAELELIAADRSRVEALRRSGIESSTKNVITEVAIQKAQQAKRVADLHLELQDATAQIPEEKLKKIAEEIIDNAFKFSKSETPVYISSSLKDSMFSLSVSDRGRGMTDSQIANLGACMQFERKLYEQQGSGLGLIIARRLAELYGGQLTIESIPEQETTVRLDLPT